MARPRTGSAYEKRGVIVIAVSLWRTGARWVRPCPPRSDGVLVDLIHARAVAADLQRRYDGGLWDPDAVVQPGTASRSATPAKASRPTSAPAAAPASRAAESSGTAAGPTVLEHARAWIKTERYESAPKDAANIERYLAKSEFGAMPVTDVRAKHVLAFIRWLGELPSQRGGTLAPRSVRNIYDVVRRSLDAAVIEELLTANPCHALHKKLPPIEDKVPGARQGWIYTRDEVERLIADPALLPDRRVSYAILFLTGMRFGEFAALRWKDWDRTLQPLTRLTIWRAIKSVSKREANTKTGAVKLVPVHPTLEAVLSAWRATGWKELMGREPMDEDFIVPERGGSARNVHNGNRYIREDAERLGIRPRHQHCARHTLISLAQDDGADGSILRWITHAPPRSAFDGYTRQQWGRLCAELGKLNIALRVITEPSAPPPKPTKPWFEAQRRKGFATRSAPGAERGSASAPKGGLTQRKHRGIERARRVASCRKMLRNKGFHARRSDRIRTKVDVWLPVRLPLGAIRTKAVRSQSTA